ncbi:MAG TPA: HAD family phosphatase [Blastocatellia bacterium]|nr:HAD family phosphatase [Blastocatellia bacterium]
MLRAIIFDCDGVIADTEPIHMASLQQVLAEENIVLTKEEYFQHYLALDDRACFTKAFAERGASLSRKELDELVMRKARQVEPVIRATLQLLPGAAEFIRQAASNYPLAVASGALRCEIDLVLKYGGLRDCFSVIVSAEDVSRSKPDPEPFIRAWELLKLSTAENLRRHECLVIEDSIHGVSAARRARMRCLAVTNSYPRETLLKADAVVDSLYELRLEDLESLISPKS